MSVVPECEGWSKESACTVFSVDEGGQSDISEGFDGDKNNNNHKKDDVFRNDSMETVRDIIGEVLNMVATAVLDINNEAVVIDASKVPFACQDVRLKPGYVKPVPVIKQKVVKEKKIFIDTFTPNYLLALPGDPVIIPDIAEEVWREASDEELGQELADKLMEEKSEMMVCLVQSLGRDVILDYFWKTQNTEEKGGLVINDGSRRRSSGGVLFHLLRVTKDAKVKEMFAQFLKDKQEINKPPVEVVLEKKEKLDKEVKEFLEEKINGKKVDKSDRNDSMSEVDKDVSSATSAESVAVDQVGEVQSSDDQIVRIEQINQC